MKTAKGFSLIELMIIIILMGILCGVSARILTQTFKGYYTAKTITMLGNKTSIVTENIMRELKSARNLNAIGNTTITFVNQQGNTIVYDLNGTTLRRSVNGAGAQTLCTDVTSVGFAYYDQGFATTATPGNVRFVTIKLVVTSSGGLPYPLMTGTVLRNLLP